MAPGTELSQIVAPVVRRELPGVLDLRHELHSRPELQYAENRTCALIRDILDGEALTVLPPFLGTDTVCILEGGKPGPTVLLRADIDALPIHEETGVSWCSKNAGVQHACGHDGHTAILTGTIMTLLRLRESLRGRVVFVFQPAEEGGGGAERLIDAGLFDSTGLPDAAFALHGWPGLPEGVFTSRAGPVMAAQDRFYIDITGSGGHGAMPQLSRDPVLAAASLIMELQSLVSRETDPRLPSVLSVCTVHGGTAENIIPDTASLSGTTRYFRDVERDFFEERIHSLTDLVCKAHRTEGKLRYVHGYIPAVNDPVMVQTCGNILTGTLGPEYWNGAGDMYMTAEDFAYFLRAVPGALLFLGLGEHWPGLHTPSFDFNDTVLETGITGLSVLALEFGKQ